MFHFKQPNKKERYLWLPYHLSGVQSVSSCCLAPRRPLLALPVVCASYLCQPLYTPSSLDPRDLQGLQIQVAPPPVAAASQTDAHP